MYLFFYCPASFISCMSCVCVGCVPTAEALMLWFRVRCVRRFGVVCSVLPAFSAAHFEVLRRYFYVLSMDVRVSCGSGRSVRDLIFLRVSFCASQLTNYTLHALVLATMVAVCTSF